MLSKLFKKAVVYPLVAVLLLIFLHYTNLLSPVENIVIKLANPVASTFYAWGQEINNSLNTDNDKKNLVQKNQELKEKVNKLLAEKSELEAVKQENEKLRKYLDFFKDKDFDKVFSEVVSTTLNLDSGETKKSILINQGVGDGIEPGAIVVNSEGIVAGKVSEVKKEVSKVQLLTSKECKLAATIQNENRVMGVARGEMGLTVTMEFVPQIENIQVGDMVVTSGLEKNIPLGLIIGRVTKVDKQSNKVWQSVNIEPLVDFDELRVVAVVMEEQKEDRN